MYVDDAVSNQIVFLVRSHYVLDFVGKNMVIYCT